MEYIVVNNHQNPTHLCLPILYIYYREGVTYYTYWYNMSSKHLGVEKVKSCEATCVPVVKLGPGAIQLLEDESL